MERKVTVVDGTFENHICLKFILDLCVLLIFYNSQALSTRSKESELLEIKSIVLWHPDFGNDILIQYMGFVQC